VRQTLGVSEEVHVIPVDRTGMWRVQDGEPRATISEHLSENDAERAARIRARARGLERIVVHDRYHRTRELATRS
jgi:hypothetical protein